MVPWRAVAESATQLDNPWVGNLNNLYRSLTFSRVRDRLICFDDLERRGKDLELGQVLGLISFLCEERNCSAVVILNDSTLSEVDEWNMYREKVFHSEVAYLPSVEVCLDIVFGLNEDQWLCGARGMLLQLDVSNMRIMSRIKDALILLADHYPSASPTTKRTIGRHLAMYSYCHNASGEGAPPIERALKSQISRFFPDDSTESRTEDEKRWDSILSKVDFEPNELDHAIIAYIKNGYPDFNDFDVQIARMEGQLAESGAEQAFSAAWDAYHNTFSDNTQAIVAKFRSAFPAAAPRMNAANANATMTLMRRLGENDLADSFINDWIEPRRGDRRDELSVDEAELFGPLTDEKFIKALNQAERDETTAPDLAEAMEIVANGQRSIEKALQTISLNDSSKIEQWLTENAGKTARAFISRSMEYRGNEQIDHAQATIRQALQSLRQKSHLNEIRIGNILKAIDNQ